MSLHKKWVIGYFIAFIVMVAMNYAVGMCGADVSDVANNNEAIIQPAGYAFSIWGLIYLLLLIWIINLFFSKKDKSLITERLTFWPILNFLLNGAWIIAFTQEWVLVSVLIIIAMLYTLAEMFTSLSATNVHWFDRLPFSIYFGWVTVATIVNIFTLAIASNVDMILGMGELTWTIIILIVATLIGVVISLVFKDWAYPITLIWPFVAIYVKSGDTYTSLDVTLTVASLVLLVVAVLVIINKVRAPMTRTESSQHAMKN